MDGKRQRGNEIQSASSQEQPIARAFATVQSELSTADCSQFPMGGFEESRCSVGGNWTCQSKMRPFFEKAKGNKGEYVIRKNNQNAAVR